MSAADQRPTLIWEVYRWSGTTPEEFRQHYIDVHAPLGKKLPGIVWYESFLTNDPDREWPIQSGRARPDAYVIIKFESEEAIEALRGTPEWRAAKLDDIGFVGNSVAQRVTRMTWIPDPEPVQAYPTPEIE